MNDIVNKALGALSGITGGIGEWVKGHLKLVIGIAAVVFALIAFNIYSSIKTGIDNSSPIVSISAECNSKFDTATKFSDNLDAFTVYAKRESGKTTTVSAEDVEFSQNKINPYGEVTEVNITYNVSDEESYTCVCEIENDRNKIVGFQCGYPRAADVVAVLYSNGELCFEGTGDVLVWYEGEYPWLTNWYEEAGVDAETVPSIKAVTFSEGVEPTNLNYAFEGLTSLEYVDKIPSTVRTMVRTFSGCTSLKNAADASEAEVLLNMNGSYSGCTSLVNADVIPENVRVAMNCFSDCTELQTGADMTKAEKLVNVDNMYGNDTKLTSAALRDGITSMNSTFSECINLKQVQNFPTEVKNLESAFSGCVSLSRFEYEIPDTVTNLTGTFRNCEILAGEITINANASTFEEMFTGACQATKINLLGNSMLLDAYANTNDSENAYVNSVKPNTSITSYSDVFEG